MPVRARLPRHHHEGGLEQQAAYLSASVPAIVRAGAAKVFVTERDNLNGRFASEGVLCGQVSDPIASRAAYAITRKPAFYALRRLAAHLVRSGQPRAS